MAKSKLKKKYNCILITIILIIMSIVLQQLQKQKQIKSELAKNKLEIAISTLDEIIHSLSENPNQFSYNINITGSSGIANSPGSTGINVTAKGGDSGSTTIGFVSTVDNSSIQLIQNEVDKYIQTKANEAIKALEDLKRYLLSEEFTSNSTNSLLERINSTYLPQVLVSLITKLVTSSLGI